MAGWLGDRIGFGRALSVALALQLAVVLIPLLAPFTLPLAVSALVMGAFTPGMPALILGRLAEITTGRDQHGAWGFATTVYALAQAGGAYLMSWLFARSHGYAPAVRGRRRGADRGAGPQPGPRAAPGPARTHTP